MNRRVPREWEHKAKATIMERYVQGQFERYRTDRLPLPPEPDWRRWVRQIGEAVLWLLALALALAALVMGAAIMRGIASL